MIGMHNKNIATPQKVNGVIIQVLYGLFVTSF